jgi:hypothetical protein
MAASRISLWTAPSAVAATWLAAKVFVPSVLSDTPGLRSTVGRGQSRHELENDGTLGNNEPLLGTTGYVTAAGGVLAAAAVAKSSSKSRRSLRIARCAGVSTETLIPSEQVGNTAPLGFFDPLGFSTGGTISYPDDINGFKFLRSAELKNGRVAMMASVGMVVQHYVKLPGFEDVPAGYAALTTSAGATGFAALVCVIGLIEAQEFANGTFRKSLGNYGDPLNLGSYNEEYQNKELNNCRMAMFAVLGQLVAEMVTGKDAIEQLGL